MADVLLWFADPNQRPYPIGKAVAMINRGDNLTFQFKMTPEGKEWLQKALADNCRRLNRQEPIDLIAALSSPPEGINTALGRERADFIVCDDTSTPKDRDADLLTPPDGNPYSDLPLAAGLRVSVGFKPDPTEIDRAIVNTLREINYPAEAGRLAGLAAYLSEEVAAAADSLIDGKPAAGRLQALRNLNWLLRKGFPPERIDARKIASLGNAT